jgi:hypothetical protein
MMNEGQDSREETESGTKREAERSDARIAIRWQVTPCQDGQARHPKT